MAIIVLLMLCRVQAFHSQSSRIARKAITVMSAIVMVFAMMFCTTKRLKQLDRSVICSLCWSEAYTRLSFPHINVHFIPSLSHIDIHPIPTLLRNRDFALSRTP
jgi:hypothetical protein